MTSLTPAQLIVQFLEHLPETVQSNICAMPVLMVDRDHKPRPGDDYLALVRELLSPERKFDEKRAVVLVAGVLDHHLSEVRGMTTEEALALAIEMPTDYFQMQVLKAPDQQRDFQQAKDDWEDLRAGPLNPRMIDWRYMRD